MHDHADGHRQEQRHGIEEERGLRVALGLTATYLVVECADLTMKKPDFAMVLLVAFILLLLIVITMEFWLPHGLGH